MRSASRCRRPWSVPRSRSGSTASPAAARAPASRSPKASAALLNRGVHPIVATTGSVGASDLMHMAAIAQVLIGQGRAEVGGEVLPGRRGPRARRPRARRPRAQGRARADLGQRRVDRAGGARRGARAACIARVADLVLAASLEVDVGQPVGARRRRAGRQARPRPGRRGRRRPRVPRRQRPVHAGRSGLGPGPALVPGGAAGPRRVARVHRRPRAPGDDRAERDGRQPAGRRRVGADAQQRQLPPDGAGHRARRASAGDRPRRAAVRPAHEPPLGARSRS